jgi:two-component system response regulator FixJ
MTAPFHIAIIDDDAAVLDSLKLYFARQNFETACFAAAPDFLNAVGQGARFDGVVSDVRMPGMTGLELVNRLKADGFAAPVILITGHGDVEMAVAAIKVGAFDFIEKPFDEARLLASIRNAIDKQKQPEPGAAELAKLRERFDTLSTRQRQVMELAVTGLSNKEIGAQLKISPKTVENHRAWVMERIGARNIAELVRIAMKVQGNR